MGNAKETAAGGGCGQASGGEKIRLRVGADLRLDGTLSAALDADITGRLTVTNPAWLARRRFGRRRGRVRKNLFFFSRRKSGLVMPRGFAGELVDVLNRESCAFSVEDATREAAPFEFFFRGELRSFQAMAAERALCRRFGVLQMPTGSGKTVLALNLVAARNQPACVVVHTRELLYQWRDRAMEFLGLDHREVGLLGDGFRELGRPFTVAVINSLYREAEEVAKRTGFLIVDECHRVPARTFTHAVRRFDSKFMLGLSATPYRRDGLTRLIHLYVGRTVHAVAPEEVRKTGGFPKARVVCRKTVFDYDYAADYAAMLSALVSDAERNRMIAGDAASFARKGEGTALVVSDRKAHCRELALQLEARGLSVCLLTGDLPPDERERAVRRVLAGDLDVLVATLQLIGEGFDCKELSALFLATPIAFSGRLLQAAGRVLRPARNKGEVLIFDYVDRPGILRNSFRSRKKAYADLGAGLSWISSDDS